MNLDLGQLHSRVTPSGLDEATIRGRIGQFIELRGELERRGLVIKDFWSNPTGTVDGWSAITGLEAHAPAAPQTCIHVDVNRTSTEPFSIEIWRDDPLATELKIQSARRSSTMAQILRDVDLFMIGVGARQQPPVGLERLRKTLLEFAGKSDVLVLDHLTAKALGGTLDELITAVRHLVEIKRLTVVGDISQMQVLGIKLIGHI